MALMRRFLVVLLVGLTTLTSVACGGDYIRAEELYADNPGFNIAEEAEIKDTTTHRQVIDVLVHYRQALVSKDFGTLKRLISEDYYDNAGTTDTTTDDYSAEHLGEILEKIAQYAQDIKYNVLVEGVEVTKERAFIDYKYDYAYQYKVGEDVAWDAGVDVNRLELIQEGGKWRIVSGL